MGQHKQFILLLTPVAQYRYVNIPGLLHYCMMALKLILTASWGASRDLRIWSGEKKEGRI